MRWWAVAIGLLVSVAIGVAIGGRQRRPPLPFPFPRTEAAVFHQLIAHDNVRVDLHLPRPTEKAAPWMVFVHERGWPAPDEKEREGAGIADALLPRGIGVAVLSFGAKEGSPAPAPENLVREVADAVRELTRRAGEFGLAPLPVLAGDEAGAALVASLALDARYGLSPETLRGVIVMNGIYDGAPEPPAPQDRENAPLAHVRADAPPFLVLSAHGESPRAAESSRAFARALERKGAKGVHAYHASSRDVRSLSNMSGDRNDVGELVAAFLRGEPAPGGAEATWALSDAWGALAPISSEAFWTDERLIVQKPTDARFRARLRSLYGEMIRDLEPWPLATYSAIDLGDYLRAHPELGTGDWVAITNARGEQLVLARSEIDRKNLTIVVGVDDERNLFRLFVTYNVHRTYSWKPETEARPLLVRSIGAFLFLPGEPEAGAPAVDGTLHVVTGADFALTPSSFKVLAKDPLAAARATPKAVAAALTNEQGCLQCHALRGAGARAHHVRAADGKLAEGFGLALEEYPQEVMRRFLFEQKEVAKSFGVGPLELSEATAKLLAAEIAR